MKNADVCKKGETKIDGLCLKVGYNVKFIEQWEIFPEDIVKKGETGKIVVIDDTMVSIKLDKHHKDLSYWNNEAHIYLDNAEIKPKNYIKVIRKK